MCDTLSIGLADSNNLGFARFVVQGTFSIDFVNSCKAVRAHFVVAGNTLLVNLVDVAKVRVTFIII